MFYDREHSVIRRDLSIDIEHVGPSAAQVGMLRVYVLESIC